MNSAIWLLVASDAGSHQVASDSQPQEFVIDTVNRGPPRPGQRSQTIQSANQAGLL